jgi:hypothetical protein
MAHTLENHSDRPAQRRRGEEASIRGMVLALVFLLVGAALCAVWLYRSSHHGPALGGEPAGPQTVALSDATLAVLQKLDSVLEVRFYSVLDPATVPDSEQAFASRVDQLLQAYQQAAGDKIKLTRFDAQSNRKLNAARADGIQAFNLDKGGACYLGVALAFKGRKEILPYISPQWEQAVEPDLTRAIIRLVEAPRPASAAAAAAAAVAPLEPDTNVVREIKALIPNLGDVSLEEGTRILREAALSDFAAAAEDMEAQLKQAEQRLAQAKSGGSDADQQAAVKQLQQVQANQNKKLQEIAARSKAQVDALQQLKAAPH